jgi:hypothetical protein
MEADMAWTDEDLTKLKEERQRYLSQIASLQSGSIAMSEVIAGEMHETTDQAVERNQRDVAEIEKILTEHGVEFDA